MALRVQLCRSVKPGGKGVPGDTIGLCRRQPKEVAGVQLDLGYEEIVVGGEEERRR